MSSFRTALTALFFMSIAFAAANARAASYMVEAEDFQFRGGWSLESARGEAVGKFLVTMITPENRKPAEAATVIHLPAAGEFQVWARSRDYGQFMPRTRRYRVAIDGTALPAEAGRHGAEGWAWERLGAVRLEAGDHMLALRLVNSRPRCDRLLLTTANENPSTWSEARLRALRLEPVKVALPTPVVAAAVPRNDEGGLIAARLENEFLRVQFKSVGLLGRPSVVKTGELKIGERWTPLPQLGAGESLFILQAAAPGLTFPGFKPIHPAWAPKGRSQTIQVGGKPYTVQLGATDNPFEAAEAQPLRACAAKQLAPGEVEVTYETRGGLQATGRWTLAPGAHDLRFTLTLTPQATAFYSVGYCAFADWKPEEVQFVELPPLFQFQRLPESPVLVPSSVTPQPYALVQARVGGDEVGFALAAEPERLPFVWPTIKNAPYGFSLLNAAARVQPCGFSPVLGYEGSRWEAGKPQTVAWRLFAAPGDWKASLERLSAEVMQLKDYRRPLGASLTDAALNMIDLIMDAPHGGWDAEMKGFYDIETQAMTKQAAPLTLLSVAALTRDERFFKERALPTVEFTLSRRRADIVNPALNPGETDRDRPKLGGQLHVPTLAYGTSYWQGAHELLGRLNPWLEEFVLPGGQPVDKVSGAAPGFQEWLAAWRFRPDPAFLARARLEADAFLRRAVYARQTKPIDWSLFYNISFYPQWWNLLDLYDATGDTRYRDAAAEGAFHTVAGLWSHPRIPEGEITIHQGGQANGIAHVWYRNGEPFRLGWPRQANDTPEHRVPAWTVAQTGLGVEQPSTYVVAGGNEVGMRNIMNATWAPHLLRAWGATGRTILRDYARNAVIGRYTNYPGYYQSVLTDVMRDPHYLEKGPDLTSIYYHHIPVHLGFTLDYLVTEAVTRSGGRVRFPYATQKNYAWFNFRVYGQMPGEVFGEKEAALWLDRAIAPCRAPEVDWLAARAPERVCFMLMNQLHEPLTVPVHLEAERLGLKRGGEGRMIISAGNPNGKDEDRPVAWETLDKVTIPALGMVTLVLPAERREAFGALPPLKKGHVTGTPGGPWGELHAFRIRSPFGADALYVVLTGEPPKGSRARLIVEGSAPQTLLRERFPYDFSVYPLKPDEDVKCSVILEPAGAGAGAPPQPIPLVMGAR